MTTCKQITSTIIVIILLIIIFIFVLYLLDRSGLISFMLGSNINNEI